MRSRLEAPFVFLCSAIWHKTPLDLQHFKINPRPHFFKVPFSVSHKQYQIFLNAPKSKETVEFYVHCWDAPLAPNKDISAP